MAKNFKSSEIDEGFNSLFKSFFASVVAMTSYRKMKQLTYVKRVVTTPAGGLYLVSVLHIDGPKFDLEQYRLVAESQEEKSNEPG